MFEELSNHDLITLMGEETREESAAMGRRLALVGELLARRKRELEEARFWATDAYVAVAAEISPVQNISHARALGQVRVASTLRTRLPRVAQAFRSGVIDYRLVATILHRTENVDDDIIGALDEAIAAHAIKWMKLSGPKLRDRVDLWVAKYDPAAVRVAPDDDDARYVAIEPTDRGMAGVYGNIRAEDAASIDQRLDALANTVCPRDPRTKEQRRADACGPMGRLEATLACQCGDEDCPATAQRAAAETAVIHVLAEQGTVEGSSDAPGYLPKFGVMPAESIRRIAKTSKCVAVTLPSPGEPESQAQPTGQESAYRPTTAAKDFVGWRDLTCRWPGCDKPAARSDIDHTVAWPEGLTHPSNIKCYCRVHHLVKTFLPGFTDQQLPNGDIILTTPGGHSYRTQPHGAAMFPALGQSTGTLDLPTSDEEPDPQRLAMMPRRKQTREQDRRDRVNAERRQRTELIAEEERQRQAWLAANYQPPPF